MEELQRGRGPAGEAAAVRRHRDADPAVQPPHPQLPPGLQRSYKYVNKRPRGGHLPRPEDHRTARTGTRSGPSRPASCSIDSVAETATSSRSYMSYGLRINLNWMEILESMGQFVDGLKFSGGSHSLMPKAFIKEITELAHRHDVYVSTGDWAEHLLREGPSSFKQYVEDCKQLGFDTIELNAGSLKVPEESLFRFIRLAKSCGLQVRPQFSVKFDRADMPVAGDRAFGSYIAPVHTSSERVEDVDLLIRKAERCLEAGADMIMIEADDVCKYANSMRADIIAKITGRLGLEKTMFEASNSKTSEWFVKQYGPRVNLFIDHSEVMNLECLRGRSLGKDHTSVWNSPYFLM